MILLGQRIWFLILGGAVAFSAGCKAPAPVNSNGVNLPVPPGVERMDRASPTPATQPAESRYFQPGQTQIDLTPMKVIHLAFDLSPQVRAAYLKYAGEKARYDYILATWTSTTPGFSVGPAWSRTLAADDTVTHERAQKVEAFLERNFLDTSRLRVFAAGINEDDDDEHGFHPAAGTLIRFPLWGSREALQRASNQIFQQTRVNDAQLQYVQEARHLLSSIGQTYFAVLGIGQRVEIRRRHVADLDTLARRAEQAGKAADLQRIGAATTTATTLMRSQESNYAIELAWMTSTMGLPRDVEVRLLDEPFNPFDGTPRESLLEVSLQVDPEIATLKNAIRDAQVQLALARKGRLDVAAHVAGTADMRGSGTWRGRTEYRAETGLSVAFVDPRLSNSLAREAAANIQQYQYAIERRRKQVYAEAMEPLIKVRMLERNIPDRQANVERYRQDYEAALTDYFAGRMNIDDLLERRQGLVDEEMELSFNKSELGTRTVALAATAGKFFELLQQSPPASSLPAEGPADTQPAALPVDPAAAQERQRVAAELMETRP